MGRRGSWGPFAEGKHDIFRNDFAVFDFELGADEIPPDWRLGPP